MRRRAAWLSGVLATVSVAVAVGALLLPGADVESDPVRGRVPSVTATTEPPSSPPPVPVPRTPPPAAERALTDLASLQVKGRAPKTGYARARFGKAWDDAVDVEFGRNGCRTREDILRRDLTGITFHADGCRVLAGTLADPYTGTTIPFTRGEDTSALVQIDHVVAMSDAWQKGAAGWTAVKRIEFANDPRNLQAVSGTVNQRKGAGDAATWLPPNKAYRCTYVGRQIEVKKSYGLWVTPAERDAMRRVLASC
ncbi:HNH endonuclease family protein [Gordonia sp. NPDC058843]|uniref:HNH endonuclease family protein n=1 Tax=Gordonia sp. NPDC058843 TaxID=3346648 RepID=UPI0036BA6C2F